MSNIGISLSQDNTKKYPIVETFLSIDGEGIRTGAPVVFVRFAGCNLRCSYCDTTYSYGEEAQDITLMSSEELTNTILNYNCNKVTFTGGEPLFQKDYIEWFIQTFPHIEVNIETNGSYNITNFLQYTNCIITMDYKCPSSNECQNMLTSNLEKLREQDVLKFVVNHSDLNHVKRVLNLFPIKSYIYLSPVFKEIELSELAQFVIDNKKYNKIRLGLQIHKIIWDPNKRGV